MSYRSSILRKVDTLMDDDLDLLYRTKHLDNVVTDLSLIHSKHPDTTEHYIHTKEYYDDSLLPARSRLVKTTIDDYGLIEHRHPSLITDWKRSYLKDTKVFGKGEEYDEDGYKKVYKRVSHYKVPATYKSSYDMLERKRVDALIDVERKNKAVDDEITYTKRYWTPYKKSLELEDIYASPRKSSTYVTDLSKSYNTYTYGNNLKSLDLEFEKLKKSNNDIMIEIKKKPLTTVETTVYHKPTDRVETYTLSNDWKTKYDYDTFDYEPTKNYSYRTTYKEDLLAPYTAVTTMQYPVPPKTPRSSSRLRKSVHFLSDF